MCKTRHEHAASEKTHKSRVHTRHENTRAHSQWKNTSCVQHSTRYNKCTQPIEARTACNTTKHTWTRVRSAERTRDRALTQWQKMERECPNPDTNRNSRHECRDPNTTLHTKQCTQTREKTLVSHMKTRTWWEYQGSVTKPWITLDRSDRTLTDKVLWTLLRVTWVWVNDLRIYSGLSL